MTDLLSRLKEAFKRPLFWNACLVEKQTLAEAIVLIEDLQAKLQKVQEVLND